MRRILVPLDGTALSAAILPEARRLAGPDGVLVLLDEVERRPPWEPAYPREERVAVEASREYLTELAASLRAENVKVETQTMLGDSPARTIDEAAMIFDADMVALATHTAEPERLPPDSIAWQALAHSSVPVLVRHVADVDAASTSPGLRERRIMVPLDGSAPAERALPLARELAAEWSASLWLVHVVSHRPITDFARTKTDPDAVTDEVARLAGQRYLDRIASRLEGHVHTHVLFGSPVDALVAATTTWSISDVVLSSHGRTGLAHAIVGGVTDSLLHRLNLPVIVVPAGATGSVDENTPKKERGAAMTTGERPQPATNAAARRAEHDFKNIVVALDGSKEAEDILPYVEPIARAFSSTITFVCALVPVEDTPSGAVVLREGTVAPGLLESVYETHELVGKEEASYLARIAKHWADRGFDVECREPRMRAAEAIVQVAREKGADLIAMATHARSGLRRAVPGSVADEVVRSAPSSVLLVRQ